MTRHPPDADRGSATLELVVLAPALLAVLATVMIAGRFEAAAGAVEQASAAAAREASLARTDAEGQEAARRSARQALTQQDLACTTLDVETRLAPAPAGNANVRLGGTITVTVTCLLDLARLTVPGMPGTRHITASTSSVRDAYRSDT